MPIFTQQGWTHSSAKPVLAFWWFQTCMNYPSWPQRIRPNPRFLLVGAATSFTTKVAIFTIPVLLCNCQVRPSFVLFEYPCATKSINVIEPTIRTSFQDTGSSSFKTKGWLSCVKPIITFTACICLIILLQEYTIILHTRRKRYMHVYANQIYFN